MTRILLSGNNITTWAPDGSRLVYRKFLRIGKYHLDLFVRKEGSK